MLFIVMLCYVNVMLALLYVFKLTVDAQSTVLCLQSFLPLLYASTSIYRRPFHHFHSRLIIKLTTNFYKHLLAKYRFKKKNPWSEGWSCFKL